MKSHHAENMVYAEQTRVYNIDRFHGCHPEGEQADPFIEKSKRVVHACTESEGSADSLKLYRTPRPSTEMPMERHMTMSPAYAPLPWLERQEMKSMGISYADLRSVETRQSAANRVVSVPLDETDTAEGLLREPLGANGMRDEDVRGHKKRQNLGSLGGPPTRNR